jgi:DNA-binding SARP family transcriptional activator
VSGMASPTDANGQPVTARLAALREAIRTEDPAGEALAEAAWAAALQGTEDVGPGGAQLDAAWTICGLALLSRCEEFADPAGFELWVDRLAQLGTLTASEASITQRFWCAAAPLAHRFLVGDTDAAQLDGIVEVLKRASSVEAEDWLRVARLTLGRLNLQQMLGAADHLCIVISASPHLAASHPAERSKFAYIAGYTRYALQDHEGASSYWQEAARLAEHAGFHSLVVMAKVANARVELERNQLQNATRLLREVQIDIGKRTALAQVNAYHLAARIALRNDQAPEAIQHLKAALAAMQWAGIPEGRWLLVHTELAQAHIALGQFAEARLAVARQAGGFTTRYGECLALIAMAMEMERDGDLGYIDTLREAVLIAQQMNLRSVLRSLPRQAGWLCARALEHDISSGFVQGIVLTRGLAAPADAPPQWPWRVWQRLLGGYELHCDGEIQANTGKAASKPQELLKLLAVSGDNGLTSDAAADALWPDAENLAAARKNLEVTLTRARKLLASAGEGTLLMVDGRVRFDAQFCGSDVGLLNRLCDQAEAMAMRLGQAGASPARLVDLARRMAQTYRGELLPGESESPWLLAARQSLKNTFVRSSVAVSSALLRTAGQQVGGVSAAEQAAALLEICIEREPLAEQAYLALMQTYVQLERNAEALHTYRRCRDALSIRLGIKPGAAMDALKAKLVA